MKWPRPSTVCFAVAALLGALVIGVAVSAVFGVDYDRGQGVGLFGVGAAVYILSAVGGFVRKWGS